MQARQQELNRKATAMSIVVALQALAAVFFIADVVGDLRGGGLSAHIAIEAAAATALLVAVVGGALHLRALLDGARHDALAVALSRRAVADLLHLCFADWRLTPAEADVALFAIKGCDAAEIARLRGAAMGTVRAQLAHIYAKAGVNSQAALVALFLDELIDPPVAIGAGKEKAA